VVVVAIDDDDLYKLSEVKMFHRLLVVGMCFSKMRHSSINTQHRKH